MAHTLTNKSLNQVTRNKPSSSSKKFLSSCSLLFIVTLCDLFTRQISASGVFEFELLDLIRLDQTTGPHHHQHNNRHHKQHQPTDPAQTILLHVCLKEPFASQLDGPCAYGQVTLTLSHNMIHNQNHNQNQSLSNDEQVSRRLNESQLSGSNVTQSPTDRLDAIPNNGINNGQATNTALDSHRDQDNEHEERGSQMTNLVRMPFTFRWTKSFTIILTAEQLINAPVLSTAQIDGTKFATNETAASETAGVHHHNQQEQLSRPPSSDGTQKETAANQYKSSSGLTATKATTTTTLIDRHVLTENGVLPAGPPKPDKLWIERLSRSSKMTVHYKFRVSCAPQYYGDGCMSFCRPRDDQFGHYECSNTGQKVCLDGWLGKDCNVARCKAGCNQQHGYCDQPDVCRCRPGWTGPRCDECIAYPGCQNGYCLSPWQCVCHKNWGGVLCDQDLNYCGSHDPCLNNGTCQNVAPARYKCACPKGFTGANCELKLGSLVDLTSSLTQLSAGCVLNPCLNNGTCIGFNNQPMVASVATTEQHNQTDSGSNDLELADEQNPPINNKQQGPIYRCQCLTGWTGDFCQWAEPTSPTVFPEISLLMNNQTAWTSTQPDLPPDLDLIDGTHSLPKPEYDPASSTLNEWQHREPVLPIATTRNDSISIDHPNNLITHHHHHQQAQVAMGHLISGVVIASAVGVFCASLMLAWCCLVAIEKGRFHFIQMNIIRQDGTSGRRRDDEVSNSSYSSNYHNVPTTFMRRVHEKIRDSFKRSSRGNRQIKPETKLSIENCLRPPQMPSKMPPSYEESYYNSVNKTCSTQNDLQQQFQSGAITLDVKEPAYTRMQIVYNGCGGDNNINTGNEVKSISSFSSSTSPSSSSSSLPMHQESLVKRGALEREIAQKKSPNHYHRNTTVIDKPVITDAQMNCPKHGHLIRSRLIDMLDHHQHHDQAHSRNICPLPRKTSPDRV